MPTTTLEPIFVPPIYFWFEKYNGKPTIMTAAILWEGMSFGLSFPVNENAVWKNIDKKKLINHLKEVVHVLSLHGRKALDPYNQLSPKMINEQEAIRWHLDPIFDKRVKAINKLIKVKEITRKEAVKLKLIDEVKIF